MKVKVLVQQIMKGSENIKENMDHVWRLSCSISTAPLGTGDATKTDEFSEKFHTALDSPPHFRKIMLQIIFSEKKLFNDFNFAT